MTFQYITNEQLNGFDSYKYSCKGILAFFLLKNPFFWSGIQINILLRNLLQQYIAIGNIIIGCHLDAILISILNYWWQHIARAISILIFQKLQY